MVVWDTQESIYVSASNLFESLLILGLCLALMVGVIKLRDWTLPKNSGYFLIVLYVCFIAEQLATTKFGTC